MPVIGVQYRIIEWDNSCAVVTVVQLLPTGDVVMRYPDGLTYHVSLRHFQRALQPMVLN